MADQTLEHKPRIRLTAFSHGAGCACKLGPGELSQVLHHLPGVVDPRVLVDAATRDDAAVFQLSAERALVATVDFFTPIVDDATQWGAIAAANALSRGSKCHTLPAALTSTQSANSASVSSRETRLK